MSDESICIGRYGFTSEGKLVAIDILHSNGEGVVSYLTSIAQDFEDQGKSIDYFQDSEDVDVIDE